MEIRHLRHFEAVFRLGSFVRAAEDMGLTQSALSRSVKTLEDELGERLFDRTTHDVSPTPVAEKLIRHAMDVLGAMSAFREEALTGSEGSEGLVRVGAGPYPAQPLLTSAIVQFAEQAPKARVVVSMGRSANLLDGLVQRDLDLVVCDVSKYAQSAYADEISVLRLPPEQLVVVYAPEHDIGREFEGGSLTTERLAAVPWALPTPSPAATTLLAPPLAQALKTGQFPAYRVETTAACMDLVRAGIAVSVVPISLARQAKAYGGVSFRSLNRVSATNDGIHFLKGKTQSALVRRFVEAVRRRAQELVEDPARG